MTHPIERFEAPHSITAGQPLKDLLDAKLVRLLGESFAPHHPSFDRRRFGRNARKGLGELGLMDRGAHIADALARELPERFVEAAPILNAALGPRLGRVDGYGLRVFFYFPHSHYIARFGSCDFEAGMLACYELTQRFTAEFCVRPFLIRYQDRALRQLDRWTQDKSAHVRRLVSEGTRPRLPWAPRLPAFQKDPSPVLPLLQRLKDDPELYVRRSVANHLGDIAKDHPQVVFDLCREWLAEIRQVEPEQAKARRWMIRHAVRHPAKKKVPEALALRVAAKG
ncbi:MAG: DNA alkylation repair protein [Planctomycetota bacterium]|jgi:3-methyladenine DNA glycosylase AlkC